MKFKNDSYKLLVSAIVMVTIAFAASWEACRHGHAAKLVDNLATPYSGESECLPNEVQSVLDFLRANRVKTVSMSPLVAQNRFLAQPLTESMYPIVVKNAARILVSYPSETMPGNCDTLKLEKGIRIANCR